MIEFYKKVVFENYANFSGRARRSEYWYFTLANVLIYFSIAFISGLFSAINLPEVAYLFFGMFILYVVGIIIPSLAVIVRRLHDTGKSGWFYFISLIPFIGSIWLLILFCTEGDKGHNEYGADPKGNTAEINEIGLE
ncbi:DUF805 domain-containing protein [Flavobacterium sp. NRK F7]|uniref:DUF805 domain-containing protein n=1 Tax=Flavobacterium sp. NRK F7 TaxID=2954930 RepID=UPI002090E9A3|nr:DUF805 domain-containing protein [Flavobacterium sp. NRK F7]MCO6161911.1 DUF805 domain-containing protein [Flavobacterium sp. NRK F7]